MTGELDVIAIGVALVVALAPVAVISIGLRVVRWLVEDVPNMSAD